MRLLASTFWASAAASAWVLAGYPASLLLRPARRWRQDDVAPSVSVIVPAYREYETLPPKLAALEQLDYPADRLQIVVVVSGDAKLAEAARAACPSAHVVELPERGGKAAAINAVLPAASGDVVLLTDANNVLSASSVRLAVRHFADPAVWAVAGQRGESGSAYDRYEDAVRRLESRCGSVAALSGEFMAVRRDRMPPFPTGVVNDDLWLLCDLVRRGGRVVYEPGATSTEPGLDASAEVARRSRIGAGRFMLLGELRGLPPAFALRLVSHKYGRLGLPFLLLATLASSLGLARRQPYATAAGAQLAFYSLAALALAGVELPGAGAVAGRAARQFVVGNVAVAIGVVRAARGRQDVRWTAVR